MSELIKKILKANDMIEIISVLSIEDLENVITYAADKYYNTNKPVISDALYDIMIDFLRMKAPKSNVLKTVGAKVKDNKKKVTLDYHLGSMDKIKPPSNQLAIWAKKYSPPYNLSDKLDGISALLTYNENKICMYTRGTATEGTDISNLVKYLELPSYETVEAYCKKHKIQGDVNMIAFRGELIIKENVFQEKFSDKLKNGRNSVAGLVNSKTINPELAKATELVLYEVVDPSYTIDKQFSIIKDIGFSCVVNKTVKTELTYEQLSKYLKERRSSSSYLIDGIIVTSSEKQERNTDGNPEYAFAFKDIMEDQVATTTILSIEWNVSKGGYLKPILILNPVTIGGVEIRRCTGNNAKFIVENVLGAGAIIELIRSGDVIPKVMKVIKQAKSGKPELPEGKWHWNETNVDIMIDDMNNNDMLVKSIYYFFSTLDTKGLGEKNVEKMVEIGLDSIKKIIEADRDILLTVDGFKDKTVDKLIASIKEALTDITLPRLMAASSKLGHGVGEERMKLVLAVYPNLLTDYKKWSKQEFIDKLKEINGWEEKTASLLVTNLPEFIKFYDSIKKHITIEMKKVTKKGIFTDKTLIFSGFRDKTMQEKIEAMGGKIGSSVSKNTDYLVVKDIEETTDKIKKATELGVKIITKDKLMKMLE